MSLRKVLSQDIESATLRMEFMRGLTDLAQGNPTRKQELHVSDFTQGEKSFCIRRLLNRYYLGDDRAKDPTLVEYDGKWREEKWKKLLEARNLLVEYQPEFFIGTLVGHPDFVIRMRGFPGLRILELTGYDSKVPIGMQKMREAIKVRQILMYLTMAKSMAVLDVRGGFVVIENKGNNSFRIVRVNLSELKDKADELFERVKVVQRWIARIDKAGGIKSKQARLMMRHIPECQKKKCDYCRPVKD